MKKIIFFLSLPLINYEQNQIGNSINGEAAGDNSGYNISLSGNGNILAIGAIKNNENGDNSGHVRVFQNINNNWTQIGSDINGETQNDYSGYSISLSDDGNTIAIGAPYNNGINGSGSGHVRVFQNINDNWTQIGNDIDGEASNSRSGHGVSLSSNGNIIAIGAILNNGINGSYSGHVRVFQNINDNWTQIGNDIDGEAQYDNSGYSISLSNDGNTIAIGAPYNNGINGSGSGQVRVFQNINNSWTQIGNDIDGETINSRSGFSVSLSNDGNTVAIGEPFNNENGNNSGQVRVFQNVNNSWTQIGNDINGETVGDTYGNSISLSGDGKILAIKGSNNDNINGSGYVKIFQNINNNWTQTGNNINGEALGDSNGYSIALSNNGNIIAIGAPFNDENGDDSGQVKVYDLSLLLKSNPFVSTNFTFYPNPTTDFLNIELNQNLQLIKVNIYNQLGQFIKSYEDKIFNVKFLEKGTYYLEIITSEGKATKTLIIQ